MLGVKGKEIEDKETCRSTPACWPCFTGLEAQPTCLFGQEAYLRRGGGALFGYTANNGADGLPAAAGCGQRYDGRHGGGFCGISPDRCDLVGHAVWIYL